MNHTEGLAKVHAIRKTCRPVPITIGRIANEEVSKLGKSLRI
jgi:hypothetical protein